MHNARFMSQKPTAPTGVDSSAKSWTGWAALIVGFGTVAAAIAASTTRAAEGLTLGFGAFIAFFGLLSLLVRNKTATHWGLFVMGLVLAMLPWLGAGFTPDRAAAWTASVAGLLAMALGGIGWLNSRPPTAYGINRYGSRATKPSVIARWISRAALGVGLVTMALGGFVAHSSAAGVAVTVGLGGLITVIAVWSMLAVDPTHDYLTLAIVGFALVLAPTVGGFADDSSAWTAWIAGSIATVLGVAGYLRGDSLDFARAVRDDADARYRARFRSASRRKRPQFPTF